MNDTVFYVLGGCLVLTAVGVSFAGLRFERFPGSKGLVVGGTILVAALVVATMTFAWRNAADEQASRDAELADSVAADEEAGNTTAADEEAGSQAPGEAAQGGDAAPAATTAAVDGAEVFASAGCTGCHTLADAGSTATTGPDLDAALKGKDEDFIRTSIVDPNDFVEHNYPPNVMPQSYEQQLTSDELDALVAYLAQVTSDGKD
jgi:mono/diheme cytochrome c family protein